MIARFRDSLFRKSFCAKTEEFQVLLRINSRLPRSDVYLLPCGLDALQVGKQKAARIPAFMLDDHAVNIWIEICERAELGLTEDIYRIFQIREFICADRCEAGIASRGTDG